VYFILTKRVICAAAFSATTSLHAATLEQSPESENIVKTDDVVREVAEYDKEINEEFIEVLQDDPNISVEDREQYEEDYRIIRKVRPDNPCERESDVHNYETNWYDESQIYINTKFCEPALWFDNFFATDRIFKEGVAGTYVSWKNDFSIDEEEDFEYKPRLNLSVELPFISDRLRLTFEGEGDEDLRDIAPGNGDETANSLGLQVDLSENARSKFSVSVNFSPRIRLRYRYTYPVFEETILRFTEEVQWKNGTNSARSRFDVEQPINDYFLFRSSSALNVSEEYDGIDWLQGFVMYQWVNKKTSLAYELSAEGITEPISITTDYRVGIRFRQNFHREWLFYEVVPEYTWPITFDEDRLAIEQDRRSKWRLLFRLELHFGNAYKRRYEDYNKVR
jgi:hypothetical protein